MLLRRQCPKASLTPFASDLMESEKWSDPARRSTASQNATLSEKQGSTVSIVSFGVMLNAFKTDSKRRLVVMNKVSSSKAWEVRNDGGGEVIFPFHALIRFISVQISN